jgi:hypothetical protein
MAQFTPNSIPMPQVFKDFLTLCRINPAGSRIGHTTIQSNTPSGKVITAAHDAAGAAIYLIDEGDQSPATKITACLVLNHNRFRAIQCQQLVMQFAITNLSS